MALTFVLFSKEAFVRWSTLPNILTDVIMLILPLPSIWNLQLRTPLKIGLTITFLTGSLYV